MLFYMFLVVASGFVFFRLASPHKNTQYHLREETA